MFKDFLYKLPGNFVRAFTGVNLYWHILAIVLTYVCVTSGFDWWYYETTRNEFIFDIAFPTAMLGAVVPVIVPVALYWYGEIRKVSVIKKMGSVLGQAAVLGWIISSLYKAFTGRLQPQLVSSITNIDLSHIFNFGFLRHGIFWGWPSSHTAVAFSMAAALVMLFPRRKIVIALAVLYAFYIGLGVSVTIHWFSDFVAGAIIGTVVGVVVAKAYRARPAV
jgi:membrane-associated phospholipid phosphatase